MLKSLELFGFKSFADRTGFDFAPGITCVVGPNGSGKSNVVDALKWILGDQSAKSLRGKEMTDVIFNGSSSRKGSPCAEATLVFDNSGGMLACEATEVHIGRRIWRSGEAEYLINRAPARLKDVRDLFLGTGSSAYSIIEQGRVDQILQGNATARRLVFEEAAGISRFRLRKQDAQRKLERVAQNLLRLTDIVDEVDGQLNTMRSQAAKASRYRELNEELKLWWHGLAADDYHALTAELDGVVADSATLQERLAHYAEEQKSLESNEQAFDAQIAELEDRLREVDRGSAASKQAIAGHEATIRHQTVRLQELESEIVRLEKQQLLLRRRFFETQQEIADTRRQLQLCEEDLASVRDNSDQGREVIGHLTAQVQRYRDEIENRRVQLRELAKTGSSIETRLATYQSQKEAAEQGRAALAEERKDLAERGRYLASARQAAAEELSLAETNHTQAVQALRKIQSKRQTLVGAESEARDHLATQREQRSAALARKQLLEDLELRQEGLGIGVREILHRAKTSKLAPWNTVVGILTDLLDVDLDNAALLEVALGPRAQLIVLREYQPFLDYLDQGIATLSGRVGFMALPEPTASRTLPPIVQGNRFVHLQMDVSQFPNLVHEAGVVRRADQLVSSERGMAGLAAAVLGDTWIVQDLATAVRLATSSGRGCRFVTLQGEVLEQNGTLHVGTIRSESAVLPRKSELRQLKNELQRLEREIAAQESQLETVYTSLTGADEELEAAAEAVDEALGHLTQARSNEQTVQQQVDRLKADEAGLAARDRTFQTELDNLGQIIASQTTLQGSTQATLQQCETEIAELTEARRRLEAEIQQHEQALTARNLDLAKQGERIEAFRNQLVRLEEELKQRDAQREEADRRYEVARHKHSQTLLHLLNTAAQRDEELVSTEAVALRVSQLAAEKADLRKLRTKIVEAELQNRRERRETGDQLHALEIREREARQALQTLAQRLEEEDQLNLEEVAGSGVSAFRTYLQQRQTAADKHADKHGSKEKDDDASLSPSAASMNIALDELTFADVRPEIEAHVQRVRRKLKMLGSVNTDSLRDLEELENRFKQLSSQLQDLVEAKNTLEDIIRRLNQESRRLFAETFETIRKNFQELFRKVFGGGEGDIILEDPDDVLECGIDIKARPPGKELRSISLLSGGEKTMTAIALIMAIFKTKPSPFCILDEVDAALDEANVERFTNVIQEFRHSTQFIMITHHKRSMVVADVLYGVTMEESGISKRMSVRFEDVSDDGHFRSGPSAQVA